MVNNNDFVERLRLVMNYYNLTATLFAEKINVQRSSISHILSGRNKPSLDFVLKVLKAFDEVDLYWLLNGKGKFPKSSQVDEQVDYYPLKETKENKNTDKPLPTTSNQEIDRIVIFYKNGTFKNYIP